MSLLRLAAAALLSASSAAALAAPAPPICTDRPTKANATCTVPKGRFQLETSAASWSRIESGGAKTDVWQVGSSVLKLGLSDRSDLQIGFAPFIRSETRIAGGKSVVTGLGDVTLRYKHRVTGEAANAQVAVIPFFKLPTARRGLGNGKIEMGIAVPVSLPVGAATLTFGPEADLLADADGKGHHVALVNLVNLAGPIAPQLTLVGEFWTMTNFDPAGTVTLASADAALAYAISPEVQLDLGGNFGLTRHTADAEVYAGVSLRF
ncbi:MAG: transporter [Pseudomonadota bacterium]